MKKYIIILILIALTLTGCGIYNLNSFILPDDLEFLEVVESLDTPKKICDYLRENFTYKAHYYYAPDPYTLWKIKEGDCSDFATFSKFVAEYNGYNTYLVVIYFTNIINTHIITIYEENGRYNYSSNWEYFPISVETIDKIVEHYNIYDYINNVSRYEVID